MSDILKSVGNAFISLFVIVNYGLILNGTVRKIVARVHGRFGPPLWQPYMDIIKTYGKRTMITHGVMFYLGPVFRLAGGIGTLMFIPIIHNSIMFANFHFAGDILLVLYFMFFGQLGMALGAGESGHPYSAVGVARGLSQMTAFELPFTLSIISLMIQYNTLSIVDIVAAQQGSILNWTLFTNPLAVITAMIAMLGMNMHSPFDIVLAPQEIAIGPPTEFHSGFLGVLQTNRSVFNAAKLVLFMNLFFGGTAVAAGTFVEHLVAIAIMVIKTFFIYMFSVFIGVAFPRFRTEQSIRFFLKYPLILGIISIIFALYFK